MRILHVLNDIRELGNGIINVAVDLACLQADAGHTVAVASLGGEFENLLNIHRVKHYTLDQNRTPRALVRAIPRFRNIARDFRPDIVHAHMMTGVVLAFVSRVGLKYHLVSTVHNEFRSDAILMGLADRVIAVSEPVSRSMRRRGIRQSQLRVVSNGTLGSPRSAARDRSNLPTLAGRSIVTVAGLFQRKGIDTLIEAFNRVSVEYADANLYIVGNGPDRAEFERIAHECASAQRIHFVGYERAPWRYLETCDIFVLASRRDPSPLVIPEAREAGCAIIASNVDGIPEALDNGQAGMLVPPGNPTQLAKALDMLLQNPSLRAEYGVRAKTGLDRLRVSRVLKETLAVYDEVFAKTSTDSLTSQTEQTGIQA